MNNGPISQIRVPFKNCDSTMIQYAEKSFTIAIEWPDKAGDNPNILFNIHDTANMQRPPPHVQIIKIHDHIQPETVQSFSTGNSFENQMMLSNCHDHSRLTAKNGQLMSTRVQTNPSPMANSFVQQNQSPYPSGQSSMISTNVESTFCPSNSVTTTQSLGQPRSIDPISPNSNLTVGQPTICSCPHPTLFHDTVNCSAVPSNQEPVVHPQENNYCSFLPMMNRQVAARSLPPVAMFIKQRPNLPDHPNNMGYAYAPLIRAQRPVCSPQLMMPRAASDVNSQYLTHALHPTPVSSSSISQSNCPVFETKRTSTKETTNQTVKAPRKRTAKPKTSTISPTNQPNLDQSLSSNSTSETNDCTGLPTPIDANKTSNIPTRQSIRIVPEEPSPSQGSPGELNKASPGSNTRSTSSPVEVSVRSPVLFESSLVNGETLPENSQISADTGLNKTIEEVVQDVDSLFTRIPPPKIAVEPADQPQKLAAQKRATEGRRKPGRPPKVQKLIFPTLVDRSYSENIPSSMPYSQLAPNNSQFRLTSNPNVCSNNIETITQSSITPVPIAAIFNSQCHQHITNSGHISHFESDIPWEENLMDDLDNSFPMTTGTPWSMLYSDIDLLNLHSVNQSTMQDSTYADILSHEPAPGSSGSTNNAMCQENLAPLSTMTLSENQISLSKNNISAPTN